MNGKILAVFFFFLYLAIGCATLESPKGPEKTPVITQSFASREIRIGDTWKIYLNASDPSGEMKEISSIVEQAGQNHPERITKVSKENTKEFSGYLYLSTASLANVLDGTYITLWVQIRDKSGNLSQPAIFPLTIKNEATQEAPPQSVFREQDLGPMVAQKSSWINSLFNSGSSTYSGSSDPNASSATPPANPARRQAR